MIYCINPKCPNRLNPEQAEICSSCGTPLLISGRLRLLKPLRGLEIHHFIEVFEVEDLGIKKVLKVLTKNTSTLVEQFEREALSLQLLSHEGIPKVNFDGYFTVTPPNSPSLHCLVMDYIEGQNLEDWLKTYGKVSQSFALNWMRQILEILNYIHTQGYFHRDLKPSNIICRPDGRLALIDFGSVRAISPTYLIAIGQGEATTAIISQGYTAPEQINGQALPQSDFYALGRTFVHLLTGIAPFKLSQSGKTGRLLWHSYAKQVSRPFAEYIDDLMAISPGERPQSSKIILQHLTEKRLFFESILRRLGSRQFRLRVTWILAGLFFAIAVGLVIKQGTAMKRAELQLEQAQESIERKDWESAIKQLKTAVNLNPNNVLYQEQLAYAYWGRGRKFLNTEESLKAKENLEEAVKLVPNYADYHNGLGTACLDLKNYSCAIEQFQKALQSSSHSEKYDKAYTEYNLGKAYEDINDSKKAFQYYSMSMPSPTTVGIIATNAFVRLSILQHRDFSRAFQLTLEALERNQKLSQDLSLIENPDKRQLKKEELQEIQATSYRHLGWIQLLKAENLQAKVSLKKAVEIENNQEPLTYCLLAKVEQNLNSNEAIPAWQNCLTLKTGEDPIPELNVWQLDAKYYLNNLGEQS